MKSVMSVIVAGMFLCAVPAFAETASSADTNMQILVQKLKADKKLVVAANMELTDAESKGFWPLYDAYQKDLQQVNERILKTVSEYAEAHNQGKGTISNDTAKKLLNEVISIEEQEVKLKRANADKSARCCRLPRRRDISRSKTKSVRSLSSNSRNRFRWCTSGPGWRGR